MNLVKEYPVYFVVLEHRDDGHSGCGVIVFLSGNNRTQNTMFYGCHGLIQ